MFYNEPEQNRALTSFERGNGIGSCKWGCEILLEGCSVVFFFVSLIDVSLPFVSNIHVFRFLYKNQPPYLLVWASRVVRSRTRERKWTIFFRERQIEAKERRESRKKKDRMRKVDERATIDFLGNDRTISGLWNDGSLIGTETRRTGLKGKWGPRAWRGRIMTGRPRDAKMVRVGTSSPFASYTTMWPSGDADGLIITKEPASHIAAGTVENEDSPKQTRARVV